MFRDRLRRMAHMPTRLPRCSQKSLRHWLKYTKTAERDTKLWPNDSNQLRRGPQGHWKTHRLGAEGVNCIALFGEAAPVGALCLATTLAFTINLHVKYSIIVDVSPLACARWLTKAIHITRSRAISGTRSQKEAVSGISITNDSP
jgi:hypothetical protein